MLSIDLQNADTAPFAGSPQHQHLAGLVGCFRGPTQLWLEPGTPPEESITELSAALLLGGRWLRMDYRGVAFGKPHAGQMLLGFHFDAGSHELAWVDSSHTGSAIMLSVGRAEAPGVVDVLGSYAAGEQRWGWRTQLELGSPDELVWRAFNIAPDGTQYDALLSRLTRVG
jgi:hypothetical protein